MKIDNPEKIRIMAFDLDGTLLDEEKRLRKRSLGTLQRAAERGIWLLISTGRGLVSLPEAVTGLDLFQYAIISNGAHIVDMKTREAVYSRLLTEEMLAPAMKYIEDPAIMREIFCKFEVYADEHCLADLPRYHFDACAKHALDVGVDVDFVPRGEIYGDGAKHSGGFRRSDDRRQLAADGFRGAFALFAPKTLLFPGKSGNKV